MRQITKESVNAFLNRKNFNKANMSVDNFKNEVYYLRLHGNIIAELYKSGSLFIMNAGWQTVTTKERLNGLINEFYGYPKCLDKGISQKNWIWYLNGKEWNGNRIELIK